MPSKYTITFQNSQRKSLPFEDIRDLDEAKKGFISAPDYKQIMAEAGNVAGDMGSYGFLMTDKETTSAALKFINEKIGVRPVVTVGYSHSHADHFGGVRGVADEADVKSGKVEIIAPVT